MYIIILIMMLYYVNFLYFKAMYCLKVEGPVNIAGPPSPKSGGAMAPAAPPVPTPMPPDMHPQESNENLNIMPKAKT